MKRVVLLSFLVLTSNFAFKPIIKTENILPKEFKKVLAAHGGLSNWNNLNSVSFTLKDWPTGANTPKLSDQHQADLKQRKHIAKGTNYLVGTNGNEAWVVPNVQAINTFPKFYLSGSLYFLGMPFVFADPGCHVTYKGLVKYRNITYHEFQMVYDSNTGDAENEFIVYTDVKTNLVKLINFPVEYPAIKGLLPRQSAVFDQWIKVNGFMVPNAITFRNWVGDKTEDSPGATFYFENIKFSTAKLPDDLFKTPSDAVFDQSYLKNK